MKRLALFIRGVFAAASVLAAASLPLPASASNGIFTGIYDEITSDLPPGATKVPVAGSGNSYEDGLSAKRKQDVVAYGKLADSAYGEEAPPAGFTRLSKSEAEKLAGSGFKVGPDGTVSLPGVSGGSGFNAMLFKDASGKIVVGFRGTEGLTAPGDLWTDAAQVVGTDGKPTTQYQAAADLLRNVLGNTSGEVVVTGHSLGGGLANFAMAANDLGGRVTGYTYNAAGLSAETLSYLERNHPGGIEKAGNATINLRNTGDPVSYVDAHVGPVYEVANPKGIVAAHGIGCLVENLEKTQNADGTRQGQATMDYKDPFTQGAEALANGLSAVLPADQAQLVSSLVAEYARLAALEAAGMLDAKLAAELDRLEKRLRKIMPGDLSSQALSETFAALKKGDLTAAGRGLVDVATGAAEDVVRAGLAKAGITGKDADAIVQGAKDAIRTAMEGGDVGGSILGSVENYVFDKVKGELGEEAANAWKNVWEDVKNGNDPWTNLQDAALKTATVKFNEFVDRVGKTIDKRLAELTQKHPLLGELFASLGISGSSFAQGAKWVWGVLTGPGSLADKLKAIGNGIVSTLKDMAGKLVQFALDKAKQFLNALVNDVAKKVVAAVNKVIDKINRLVDKANALIGKINSYIRKIKDFSKRVQKISARAGKLIVDSGGGATSEGVELLENVKEAARQIDVYFDELPTFRHVPTLPQPAGP